MISLKSWKNIFRATDVSLLRCQAQKSKRFLSSKDDKTLYIALGTNMGDRASNILNSLRELKKDIGEINKTSFLYETAPQYIEDQPRFLNAACEVKSDLEPSEILTRLKAIEKRMGRVQTRRNGPRVIDLDIIFYEDEILHFTQVKGAKDLMIPHPRIAEREFVLRPLNDLNPEIVHPQKKETVSKMLSEFLATKPRGADLARRIMPLPKCRQLTFDKGTLIMGVVNCTPDSFSDGGQFGAMGSATVESKEWVSKAIDHAAQLVEEGADIVDIGGESTRPGASPVPVEEEIARVVPVISGLRDSVAKDVAISVDTRNCQVAAAAVAAGADIINDVSGGLHDSGMLSYISSMGLPIIMMHMKGNPQTMNSLAHYDNVINEVSAYLLERVRAAEYLGIPRWNQMLDPGLGFAKDFDHNMRIMKDLDKLIGSMENIPLLLGPSRKRFIGTLTGEAQAKARDWGTAAALCLGIQKGVQVMRVHNVKAMKQVVTVYDAMNNYGESL